MTSEAGWAKAIEIELKQHKNYQFVQRAKEICRIWHHRFSFSFEQCVTIVRVADSVELEAAQEAPMEEEGGSPADPIALLNDNLLLATHVWRCPTGENLSKLLLFVFSVTASARIAWDRNRAGALAARPRTKRSLRMQCAEASWPQIGNKQPN